MYSVQQCTGAVRLRVRGVPARTSSVFKTGSTATTEGLSQERHGEMLDVRPSVSTGRLVGSEKTSNENMLDVRPSVSAGR